MAKLTFVHIFLTLTFLVVCITAAGGIPEHVCSLLDRPHPRGICGARLADFWESLCRPNRQTQRAKRDAISDQESDDILSDITLSKPNAMSYLTKRQAITGLVCECCFNVCTPNEVLQYCSI